MAQCQCAEGEGTIEMSQNALQSKMPQMEIKFNKNNGKLTC